MIYRRRNQKNLIIVIYMVLIVILSFSTFTKAETTETTETNQENSESNEVSENSPSSEGSDSEDSSSNNIKEDNSLSKTLSDPIGVYYELDEKKENIPLESEEFVEENSDKNENLESDKINESKELEDLYYELKDITNESLDEPFLNNTPIIGNIIEKQDNQTNLTDYYVELEDLDNIKENFDFDFSKIQQEKINFEEPVIIYQTLTLKNEDNYSKEIKFNLWNYQKKNLEGARSIKFFKDDKLISEQPIFNIKLESEEESEIKIIYEYPKIKKEIIRQDKTIKNLLPSQAKVISSEISVDTVIQEIYNIRIYHEGPIHYFDINVPINEIDSERIKSIYFVEGKEYLSFEDNIVVLPGTEN